MTPSHSIDQVACGDCLDLLPQMPENSVDLVFADPPFNTGFRYDIHHDEMGYGDYVRWTRNWMRACKRVLKPTGSFWIAISAEFAAEIRRLGQRLGLTLRNWIIWHYTFGQHARKKFARSHTHIFYFTADAKEFTFNDRAVRIFSDREKEYNDQRASRMGRLPDDVWDEFPRISAKNGERSGFHPCQMPVGLLSRIIRISSNPGDVVLDPFTGSGTTLVAAKKLNRHYIGTELSDDYARGARERLAQTKPMTDFDGEPHHWPEEHIEVLKVAYSEFKVTTDLLIKHPDMMERFAERFNWRLQASGCVHTKYSTQSVAIILERLRSHTQLPRIRALAKERRFDRQPCDDCKLF
ncbi:MAG: site-specific DNA-methyltransferase [Phycisphaerales bacterium]|jgi:DNA modification methylase|nr:site-specific DNA-methyltransferase [Phycisphaerales bacterium]